MNEKFGVLLTNVGTPDAPTVKSVRKFLKKFLSDTRVVNLPQILWKPILHGYILPWRSPKSAALYQKIWQNEGSPLLTYSQKTAAALQKQLTYPVEIGMHYSDPSIQHALENLREYGVQKLLLLPLFPQYAESTTAVAFDQVAQTLKKWHVIPELRTIHQYEHHPAYIQTLHDHITNYWEQQGKPEHLLFSFHGLPEKNATKGDPYPILCHNTAETLAARLGLLKNQWSIAFQSRLGKARWLSPYTDKVLAHLPKQGIEYVQVICPGFTMDCLETLEEINIRGKEQFMEAGGKKFHYIPALNDSPAHIAMLTKIISAYLHNW